MKKFYNLIISSDESLEGSIVPYSKGLFDIDEFDICYHRKVKKINPNFCFYWDDPVNEFFPDYLANDLGWPLMSEKMKNIIENYCKNDAQFFPIDIINTVNRKKITYYLLNILKYFNSDEVLDIKNSKHSNIDNYIVIFIFCFYKDKIEGANIFHLKGYETTSIFISDTLKRALVKAKITGCYFGNVWLS